MASKEKLLESAQKFINKGQIAKAIGDYQKLVDAFPKDFRFRQKLAELLTRERRHQDAQSHYEAVAKNFAETGFYLKAIAIYKQMQKVEPNRPDLYLCLAELNVKQGLSGNALTEYRITSYNVCYTKLLRCLGSMIAARKLYPGAAMVFPGGQERTLREFFQKNTQYTLDFQRLRDIDLDRVDRLILVDVRQSNRIGSRITSYNVCYTKLLRSQSGDDHEQTKN